jgi:hypothetical protein
VVRELISDLFIWPDDFASGLDQPPYFGYFGPDLDSWVREHLAPPQRIILGRVTFEALAQFAPSATDEISVRMNALAKLAFSSKLAEPLAWKNTRMVKRAVGRAQTAAGRCTSIDWQHPSSEKDDAVRLVDHLRLMVFP